MVVGDNCERFLGDRIKDVEAERIELDELWDFVAMKAKTKERKHRTGEVGDIWTWLAIDADSKLIPTHAVGQRDEPTCSTFLTQLNDATAGPCQVTSDGLNLYRYGVPFAMGPRVDFAQLIKTYAAQQSETRYSPATITGIDMQVRFGNPDEDLISTSYSERLNLSVRMHVRRYTRLTNAHSKSARHHAAMTALFRGWYNACRPNMAHDGKTTPMMAAGLTDHVWTIQELLKVAA